MVRRRMIRCFLRAAAVALATVLSACSTTGVPEVPPSADGTVDPVLSTGRQIYIDRCANCHGNDGSGGRGTKLASGVTVELYPQIEEQIAVVADGVRLMPSFAEALTEDEILAVVRYTREVL